jgi:putative two-component system response regulator
MISRTEVCNLNPSVLIVDDDPFVLESLSTLLHEYSYSAVACENAGYAMDKLQEDNIDVVLTDVAMPGITGIEFLGSIRAVFPEIPVILMTGFAELDTAVDAIKKGAFDFIIKPYKPDYIIHAIAKAVNHRRLSQIEKNYKEMLEDTVRIRTREAVEALKMVKKMSLELIQRLTSVAEFRDVETGSHIKRIGLYAAGIAAALGMPADFVEKITFAGPMHDIGKIGIPDNILLKPGPLTEEEFEIMKLHPGIGGKILSGSVHEWIELAESIALSHHERWDGTGYPKGLRGEEIPFEGRLVMLCDQYDALRSKRPYSSSLSHRDVFKVLTEGDGRTSPGHFDPDVLNAFVKVAPQFDKIFDVHQD